MINKAIAKLDPFKQLTTEQQNLINRILTFTETHLQADYPAVFTIYGDAGTGKSVVLSALFTQIQIMTRQKEAPFKDRENYFLVNHPEILKVYKQIAGPINDLYKKDYMRPTSFINQMDKKHTSADVVVIDEAHLLLS